MAKKYDVIVVGAGPAGLMAAKAAGENGLEVALLERKVSVAEIHRSDAGVLDVSEYMFGQILKYNERDRRLCFPVSGFTIPYDGPHTNIYGFQLHSPGGRRVIFGDWEEVKRKGDEVRVGIALSKESLLEGVLREAESYHVDVFPGTNVTGIKKVGDAVRVEGDGKTFEGTFVIAADGVNSRIASILGFNKERGFSGTFTDISWIMEGDIPIDPGSFNFIVAEKGTFDVLPSYREGLHHVGMFSFDPRLDLNAALERFTTEDRTYARWFKKTKRVGMNSSVVNAFAPIKEPFKDNVLLVGDAAWLREISNVAAFCAGWKAAQAITLAILDRKLDKEGISSYLKWWEEYLYGPYGALEPSEVELQDFLSAEQIDYLASLVEKPLPASMNLLTLFGQVAGTYTELLPRIEQERPEVMAKLIEIGSKFDELKEERKKLGFPNR